MGANAPDKKPIVHKVAVGGIRERFVVVKFICEDCRSVGTVSGITQKPQKHMKWRSESKNGSKRTG